MKALTCEVGEASATLVGHPKSIIENKMENIDCWERNKQISIEVDRMFAESDKAVFEILHKIAALAINNALSSNGRTADSESVNCGSNPREAAKNGSVAERLIAQRC